MEPIREGVLLAGGQTHCYILRIPIHVVLWVEVRPDTPFALREPMSRYCHHRYHKHCYIPKSV